MQKVIFKVVAVALLFFLLTTCSKKTSAVEASKNPRVNQDNRQQRGERPQFSDLLARMDKNKDGKLAQSEVQGRLKNDYTRIDKDRDGFITESEFNSAGPPARKRRN